MSREKVTESLLTIATGFLFLFLFVNKFSGFDKAEWMVYVSFSVGFLGLASSWMGEKITWLWLKLAEGLGYVNGRILLSLIFFVFLVPLAFLSRIGSSSSLQLKRKKEGSYYADRDHEYSAKDLEKGF